MTIEYKAKLSEFNIIYVNAKGLSSYCPICGERLSPNGQYRRMKCGKCGFEEDRDIIAVSNLLKKYQIDVGTSSVHPESPPMKRGGKTTTMKETNIMKVADGQNGFKYGLEYVL